MRRIIQPFNIVERVLRDRIAYFAEIARGEELPRKIADLRPFSFVRLVGAGLDHGTGE